MSTYNVDRFYYNEYDNAVAAYKSGNSKTADNTCRELISTFECPRLIQAQAWQLRSLCTDDYWEAKAHITSGLELLERLEESGVRTRLQDHGNKILEDIEKAWREEWESKGQEPPKEPGEVAEGQCNTAESKAEDGVAGIKKEEMDKE